MRVIHKINPVWNSDSSILILGSIPSAASRNAGFFYMHSQNRFWPVMAEVFGESFAGGSGRWGCRATVSAIIEKRR